MTDTGATNIIFLTSDQHNRDYAGYAGHPIAQTPNLDALAESGTVFENAYCTSPICVPSRASLATGRYAHETDTWDNGTPYAGQAPSWAHRAEEAGSHVTTIGKLHYLGEADTGFRDQRLALNADGTEDLFSSIRDDIRPRPELSRMIRGARPGRSSYTAYDEAIADDAVSWLHNEAHDHDERPWALWVSFVSPHHPLIAPAEYVARYDGVEIPAPIQNSLLERPKHPVLETLRAFYGTDVEFDADEVQRARLMYLALTTFLDAQVGKVLDAVRDAGWSDSTRIIYTSDHGDNVGDHGLWWKNNMYEGAVAVPLIIAGPGIPSQQVVSTPASLLDIHPTILDSLGAGRHPDDDDLQGTSLIEHAVNGGDPDRAVFSEYHAAGSSTGIFMIRQGRYKYVEYVGESPQLFDMENDPHELSDLAADPAYADVMASLRSGLRSICDPEQVNAQCKARQRQIVEDAGGEEAVRARGFYTSIAVPPQIQGPFDDAFASASTLEPGAQA